MLLILAKGHLFLWSLVFGNTPAVLPTPFPTRPHRDPKQMGARGTIGTTAVMSFRITARTPYSQLCASFVKKNFSSIAAYHVGPRGQGPGPRDRGPNDYAHFAWAFGRLSEIYIYTALWLDEVASKRIHQQTSVVADAEKNAVCHYKNRPHSPRSRGFSCMRF